MTTKAIKTRRLNRIVGRIVKRLFTNGSGMIASRIVLTDDNKRDLGGWCQAATFDQIKQIFESENIP
jgi:hypothetical protein